METKYFLLQIQFNRSDGYGLALKTDKVEVDKDGFFNEDEVIDEVILQELFTEDGDQNFVISVDEISEKEFENFNR